MDSFCCDYAVIGGDLRQVYLAEALAAEGGSIACFALCQPAGSSDRRVKICSSLEMAVSSSLRILCPIPMSRDGIYLNQNVLKGNLSVRQLLLLLKPSQRLFAGCIPEEFSHEASKKGVLVYDFMKDKTLTHFNSIATAEGIICEAIQKSPFNLHKSKCAVLGYGTCGRMLADKLRSMFCHVTAAAAPEEELAQAAAAVHSVMNLDTFCAHIAEFDFIFNTIPAVILTKEVLSHVKAGAVILDIASSPGGVDFAAAKELSVNAASYPGLPGKYAPLSSAEAIRASMKRYERS